MAPPPRPFHAGRACRTAKARRAASTPRASREYGGTLHFRNDAAPRSSGKQHCYERRARCSSGSSSLLALALGMDGWHRRYRRTRLRKCSGGRRLARGPRSRAPHERRVPRAMRWLPRSAMRGESRDAALLERGIAKHTPSAISALRGTTWPVQAPPLDGLRRARCSEYARKILCALDGLPLRACWSLAGRLAHDRWADRAALC